MGVEIKTKVVVDPIEAIVSQATPFIGIRVKPTGDQHRWVTLTAFDQSAGKDGAVPKHAGAVGHVAVDDIPELIVALNSLHKQEVEARNG